MNKELIQLFGTLYNELRTHKSGHRQLSKEEHKEKLVRTDSETNQTIAIIDIITTIVATVVVYIIVVVVVILIIIIIIIVIVAGVVTSKACR